jgi:hypothetical protein
MEGDVSGHNDGGTFGPDSWWSLFDDEPDDDAGKDVVNNTANDQQMQECLDEHLNGNRWTNRVRYFFERNGDTEQ